MLPSHQSHLGQGHKLGTADCWTTTQLYEPRESVFLLAFSSFVLSFGDAVVVGVSITLARFAVEWSSACELSFTAVFLLLQILLMYYTLL